jgi:hypothetical protein
MELMKTLFAYIARMIVLNIVLILFFASAPFLYVTVPFWFVLAHPDWNPADLATVYMLTGPFACGFWMTVICHWHTVRKAQREGRLANWRDSEGGMVCTVGKSFGFMVMGFFGSALTELVFSVAFRPLLWTFTGRLVFFAMAPFAVFAPVWIVLLCRWMRSRKREDFIRRTKNDRETSRQVAGGFSLREELAQQERALTDP